MAFADTRGESNHSAGAQHTEPGRGAARHERVSSAAFDHPLREALDARAFWRNTTLTDPDAGFAIVGSRGRFLTINDTSAEILLGMESAPLYGLSLYDILPSDIAAERMGFFQQVLRKERPLSVNAVWRGIRCRERWELLPGDARLAGHVLWLLRRTPVPWPARHDLGVDVVNARANDWGPLAELNDQERRVLALMASGCTNSDIAVRMHILPDQVTELRKEVRAKLHGMSKAVMIKRALLAGLVEPDNLAEAN